MISAQSILSARGLRRQFGGIQALGGATGLDIDVYGGEILAVLGPNGAGKTTLFNLLTRSFDPSEGKIFLAETDITTLSAHHLPGRGLARTFQRTSLFWDLTVRENIRLSAHVRHAGRVFPLRGRDTFPNVAKVVSEVLERVGLEHAGSRLARELSHGDQRLLEVAIALASDPKILLLDEPLAGMAPQETERAVQIFRSMSPEVTLLIIEHDIDVILSLVTRMIVLNFGELLAQGTPAEIRSNELVQSAYFGEEV